MKKQRTRKGATAVEFALVFPIVISFFAAIIAFSQAVLLRDTSQYAAYMSAREGINLYANRETVVAAAEEALATMRVRNPKIMVSPTVIEKTTEKVTVSVEIPFSDNAWIGAGFIPEDWSFGSEITLTKNHFPDQ